MGMGKAALDEDVTDQAHHQQQESRHGGESDDSPQHHFARPHRLGHHRVIVWFLMSAGRLSELRNSASNSTR